MRKLSCSLPVCQALTAAHGMLNWFNSETWCVGCETGQARGSDEHVCVQHSGLDQHQPASTQHCHSLTPGCLCRLTFVCRAFLPFNFPTSPSNLCSYPESLLASQSRWGLKCSTAVCHAAFYTAHVVQLGILQCWTACNSAHSSSAPPLVKSPKVCVMVPQHLSCTVTAPSRSYAPIDISCTKDIATQLTQPAKQK